MKFLIADLIIKVNWNTVEKLRILFCNKRGIMLEFSFITLRQKLANKLNRF
jgi:hypothetical protein